MWSSRRRGRALAGLLAGLAVLAGLRPAVGGDLDLGVIGPVYPIQEPDMLRAIEARLREKARTGELARLEREGIARAERTLREPRPVDGLRRAVKARVSYFDPSVAFEQEVRGPDGQSLVPAGTRVNPLDYVALSSALLFLDARDQDQVRHGVTLLARHKGRLKPILVGGSYVELTRAWRTRVYYDQGGVLVGRLGIQQVPALVTQEGKRLRIEEIPL
jgi:conjugal transfer pilus assembly protein TraW